MTAGKVMLICSQCSMRIRGLKPEDVPERGIVCRCGHRLLPATLRVDPGRRRAPADLPACELRGAALNRVDCGCQGQVRVFGCAHPDNAEGLALSHRPGALKGLPEDSLPSCRQCPFAKPLTPALSPALSPTVSPETPRPTLLQMGATATLAGVRFLASGGKLLDRPAREQRLAICRTCPQLAGQQCVDCGCLVAVKSWLPAETCPQKNWPNPSDAEVERGSAAIRRRSTSRQQ